MNKIKILLAPNSFKECADSIEICELFTRYLSYYKNIELFKHPISDGGDGFLNTLKYNFKLKVIKFTITTPYDDSKFECEVLYDDQNKTVYIESAKVLGLHIIPKDKRHPLFLSSKGMGELLEQINNSAIKKDIDVKKVVIGIGGTGTNDFGLGACSVFGLKLIDIYGKESKIIPANFPIADKILWSKPNLQFKIEQIVDVNNPLLGKLGAAYQFARQKGAENNEIKQLENGFENILNLLGDSNLTEIPNNLSGAGGGLAAGFSLFFNAKTLSSYKKIESDLGFKKILEHSDYIITGEGAFDKTSLLGKGTDAVINLADKLKKNIFLCCGSIDNSSVKNYNTLIPIEMNEITKKKEYKKYLEEEIKIASNKIIHHIKQMDL